MSMRGKVIARKNDCAQKSRAEVSARKCRRGNVARGNVGQSLSLQSSLLVYDANYEREKKLSIDFVSSGKQPFATNLPSRTKKFA